MIEFEYVKDIMIKNKFAIIAFLFALVSIVGSGIYIYQNNKNKTLSSETENIEVKATPQKEETKTEISSIKVDIKGAVKKQGVYELKLGSTVMDAITSAGGLTSKASTKNINLSRKLSDEMVIYVFTKDELKKRETSNEVVCEIPKCECETIEITECPSVNTNNNSSSSSSSNTNKTDKVEDNTLSKNKVSLNKGTIAELTTLDGIGEAKALAIIEYREKNGPFKNLEDIMNVSGIGEKAYEKIKDKIEL